jgi:hypothetical protein
LKGSIFGVPVRFLASLTINAVVASDAADPVSIILGDLNEAAGAAADEHPGNS